MRACVFDIETSSFDAVGAGVLLCAVVLPLEGMAKTYRYDRLGCKPGHEKKLVAAVIDALGEYDLWIGHNIERFDIPWLQSRARYFRVPFPHRPFTYDTCRAFGRLGYKTVPNGFGKPSKSLGHVTDFFGLPNGKTPIYPRQHWVTVWGEGAEREKAMAQLVDHCQKDVRDNEQVYWALIAEDRAATIKRIR